MQKLQDVNADRVYFGSKIDAQAAKCFSRRHRTEGANRAAREDRAARRKAQLDRITAACAAREARGPEGQLKLLDERFGVGLGATRERARLHWCITERKLAQLATVEKQLIELVAATAPVKGNKLKTTAKARRADGR